jgi:hypothetical protein
MCANPFGNGDTAQKIITIISDELVKNKKTTP